MASSATSSASSAPSSSGQPLTTTKTIVTTTTTTTAATAVHSGGGRGGGANLATSGVPVARSPSPRPVPPHKPLPHPSLDESIRAITIPAAQVQVDRTSILGKGSFGVAYKATYVSTQVAVKELLTPVLSPQVREELAREISTLKSSLHPNIIRFYGLIRDRQDGPYAIVVEYASFGSLFDFYIRNPKESVTLDGRIELLYQTAAGLAYLHDHLGIIHRDVKSPNVLLTKDPESQGIMAKISDFGLATLKNEAAVISKDSKPVGTLLWMAPETMDLLNSTSTRKSDVFSYAVVMTEVLGWVGVYGLPWRSMPRPTVVVNTITDPVRRQTIFDKMCMTVFNKAPDGILDLFEKCWDLKPENRPEFSEIVAVLQSVLRELDAQSG
ncbi:kinase-like domain-containing protein [Zopfochytrium polystomum]|nr:kinase-like domain-containing protein [Zopfochytrium polystomum]